MMKIMTCRILLSLGIAVVFFIGGWFVAQKISLFGVNSNDQLHLDAVKLSKGLVRFSDLYTREKQLHSTTIKHFIESNRERDQKLAEDKERIEFLENKTKRVEVGVGEATVEAEQAAGTARRIREASRSIRRRITESAK